MNEIKFTRLINDIVSNRLRKLDLRLDRISTEPGKQGQSQLHRLLKALESNSSIESLDLSGMKVTDISAVGQFLSFSTPNKRTRHISEINLKRSGVEDEQLKTLSFALRKNINTIGKLNLSNNNISERGVKELGLALSNNSKLYTLVLDNNPIGHKGVKYLLEGFLKKVDKLQTLSLSNCDLGDQGAIEVAKIIEASENLVEVNLGYNSIGDQGALRLAQALQNNANVRCVRLERNMISDTAAKALFSVLQYKTNLRMVDLDNNPITFDLREDIKMYIDSEDNIKGVSNNQQPKIFFQESGEAKKDSSGVVIQRPFEKKDISQLIFNETKSHGIAVDDIKSPGELRLVIQKTLDTGEYDEEIKSHLKYLVELQDLSPEGYPEEFFKRLKSIRLLANTEDATIIESLINSSLDDYKTLLAEGDTLGTEIELKIASKLFDVRFDIFEKGKFRKSIGNEFQASVINLEKYDNQFQSYISPFLAENEKTTIYHSNKIISEFKRFFTKKSQEITYHFDEVMDSLNTRLDALEKKLGQMNENGQVTKTMLFSGGPSIKKEEEKADKLYKNKL